MPFTHSIRAHFSQRETASIRSAIRDARRPTCPRCNLGLTSALPIGGRCSRHEVWELHCDGCHHGAVMEKPTLID